MAKASAPSAHSYTGEAVLELQGHGGPVVLDLLLARACALGARPARPGEFTERAFLNGRMDLAQAEAVADLIDAASAQAARAALASLDGVFSQRVHALADGLLELRLWVEAAIDFPEEDIDFLADGALLARADALASGLDALLAAAVQGRLLSEGMRVVIAGRPNAGKSSLLNRLAGYEAAIVTDIPGTTRDVLRERIAQGVFEPGAARRYLIQRLQGRFSRGAARLDENTRRSLRLQSKSPATSVQRMRC